MLLTKTVDVKIINHNVKHYLSLGYDVKCGDNIDVPVDHLTKGSHYIISIKCDCSNIVQIKYQDYIKVTNKNGKYLCNDCRKNNLTKNNIIFKNKMCTNRKNSIRNKYGVDNVFQLDEVKKKIVKTHIDKYGVSHFRQNEKILKKEKQNRIIKGQQLPDNRLRDFELYKKITLKYTRRNLKELNENWNGIDYYDNEEIRKYKELHFNDNRYPHVDHKISIFKGFKNNIIPQIIGDIDNLCITKRINNLSKGSLYSQPKKNISNVKI